MRRTLALVVFFGLTAAACSEDPPPELTFEDRMELLEERELTPAEVSVRLEKADLLCGLEDEVLKRVWLQLEEEQFAFQKLVFQYRCANRLGFYNEATATIPTTAPPTTAPPTTRRRTTTTRRRTTTSAESEDDGDVEVEGTTTLRTERTTTTRRTITTTRRPPTTRG